MSDYLVRGKEIYNQAKISKDESELIKLLQKSFQLVKEVVNDVENGRWSDRR